jgi:hypothetical protein
MAAALAVRLQFAEKIRKKRRTVYNEKQKDK